MRAFARQSLPFVAALFVACTVLQVFLAGLGVFDGPARFIDHRMWGYMFGWLTLALLVLALVARAGRRLVSLTVVLLVLFALQSVFVALRADQPAIAALHPLNGFLILGAAVVLTREAWRVRRQMPGASATGAATPATSTEATARTVTAAR
jgi:hypothetical protein